MNNNKDKAKLTKQLGYITAAVSAVGGFILAIITQGVIWVILGFVSALFVGTIYDTLGTILEEVIELRNINASGDAPNNTSVPVNNINNPDKPIENDNK